jgi:serine/threonine protein kinase
MMGYGKKENVVYLIDFGLVKKISECAFRGFSDNNNMSKKMAGTPIYSSINAHMATGGKLSYSIKISYI